MSGSGIGAMPALPGGPMRDMPAELPAGTAERCRAVAGRADQDVTDVESGSRCPEALAALALSVRQSVVLCP